MARISVLVTPRDPNPYQDLLYEGVSDLGVRVHYADDVTPSHTLNVLLAPFLLVWYRLRGYRILHIHWSYKFSLPWAGGRPWARFVMEWWFRLYLDAARQLGYQIVWTAHDLLPFEQVDARDQGLLIAKSRSIIALSKASADTLRELGASNVHVVPIGSYSAPYTSTIMRDEARANLGFSPDDVVVTLMGRVERYKGADLLLTAARRLPQASRIKVMIIGSCSDDVYRSQLMDIAETMPERALLQLEWIPEDELGRYLHASDFAAFPFRDITNSSSVVLAQSFGLPVVIPDLKLLSDVPADTAIRYLPQGDELTDSLVAALESVDHLAGVDYDAMSSAATAWAHNCDWSTIAQRTVEVYESTLKLPSESG
jgi:glycosyltransferase involved in cell wall biosynthesis